MFNNLFMEKMPGARQYLDWDLIPVKTGRVYLYEYHGLPICVTPGVRPSNKYPVWPMDLVWKRNTIIGTIKMGVKETRYLKILSGSEDYEKAANFYRELTDFLRELGKGKPKKRDWRRSVDSPRTKRLEKLWKRYADTAEREFILNIKNTLLGGDERYPNPVCGNSSENLSKRSDAPARTRILEAIAD
jgi:hypothetical protein